MDVPHTEPQDNPEDSNPQGQNPSTPVEDEQMKANRLFKEDIQSRISSDPNADLSTISLEGITSLEGLFKGKTFNGNISNWDVSKIKNFKSMFEGSTFNFDISKWDISSAQNMQFMFKDNTLFNQNLSSWVIDENKTLFASIFKGATNMLGNMDATRNSPEGTANMPKTIKARYDKMVKPLDESVGELKKIINAQIQAQGTSANTANYNYIDTSDTTSFYGLFDGKRTFNGKINDWDTSKVTTTKSMFYDAEVFNTEIENWDVSKVTTMQSMFWNAKAFNQPLEKWNTSSLKILNNIFTQAISFNQNLNAWDVSKVRWMDNAFKGATAFNGRIGKWNTQSVVSMPSIFESATSFNQPIGNWNVSSVTHLSSAFKNATSFNQDLNAWDSKLGNLAYNLSTYAYKETIFDGATSMLDANKPLRLR